MSTPVTVPAAISPEDHNNRIDRLKVGRLEADVVAIGNPTLNGRFFQMTPALSTGSFGTGTTNICRFKVIDRICYATYFINQTTASGAVNPSGVLTLQLPVAAASDSRVVGVGLLQTTTFATGILAMLAADTTTTVNLAVRADPATVTFQGVSSSSTAGTRIATEATWILRVPLVYEIA